jgi:hypothetical protein
VDDEMNGNEGETKKSRNSTNDSEPRQAPENIFKSIGRIFCQSSRTGREKEANWQRDREGAIETDLEQWN